MNLINPPEVADGGYWYAVPVVPDPELGQTPGDIPASDWHGWFVGGEAVIRTPSPILKVAQLTQYTVDQIIRAVGYDKKPRGRVWGKRITRLLVWAVDAPSGAYETGDVISVVSRHTGFSDFEDIAIWHDNVAADYPGHTAIVDLPDTEIGLALLLEKPELQPAVEGDPEFLTADPADRFTVVKNRKWRVKLSSELRTVYRAELNNLIVNKTDSSKLFIEEGAGGG